MPEIRDSLVNSLVGAGSAVDGDLDVEGMLRVDGDLRGSVRATGKVVVGQGGRVEASIRARSAIIGGAVKGDVYVAERVRLLAGAVVVGNVFAPYLEVEEGAVVHGDLAVTGRASGAGTAAQETLEEELKAFVRRHGGHARFLGRFRESGFAAAPAGEARRS